MDGGPRSDPATPRAATEDRRTTYGWPIALSLLALAGLSAAPLLREARAARAAGEDEPALWVDPAAAVAGHVPEWIDPRWLERVRAELARTPPFDLSQGAFLDSLRASLAGLSFVERVERCEATPEGELALELTLREPVACIPSRGDYLLVDGDGVVLEGRWALPPRRAGAPLPVLASDPLFERARPGDWLAEPVHADALDVALSLAEHLTPAERARLGPVVIDAEGARHASVEEPGVRLTLSGARQALFGRAPSSGEPGELSTPVKWRSLVHALELFARAPETHDWSLVDLRWDRPELVLVNPVESTPAAEPVALARAPERSRLERDPSRPRVR